MPSRVASSRLAAHRFRLGSVAALLTALALPLTAHSGPAAAGDAPAAGAAGRLTDSVAATPPTARPARWTSRSSERSLIAALNAATVALSPRSGSAEAAMSTTAARPAGAELGPVVRTGGRLVAKSDASQAAERLLGRGHTRYETRHWVVYSDADVAWSRAQTGRLERTVHEFERVMGRLGITPDPLRHKLVCVLFERRADYRQFASEADGVTAEWVAGYYSPSADRTVFYHAETNPSVIRARAKLAELEGELSGLESDITDARRRGDERRERDLMRWRDEYKSHLGGERKRIDAFSDEVGIATTVHEATHQLLFHRGVQSTMFQQPLWISEGLATAFETDDPSAAFGPDHEYPSRRDRFAELMDDGALLDTRELVTWLEVPVGRDGDIDVLYHQSYALTTWLFHRHRPQLRNFLAALRSRDGIDARSALDLFEASFGPVETVERRWLQDERRQLRRVVRGG